MDSAERIERNSETDEDLDLIFAPGSSLGGARPKASVMDAKGNLAIAKFPKDTDDYPIETWEHIALILAANSGISVDKHDVQTINEKPVLLSWRFDRMGQQRIPFLSAMSLLQAHDGERGSYVEVVDELSQHSANTRSDSANSSDAWCLMSWCRMLTITCAIMVFFRLEKLVGNCRRHAILTLRRQISSNAY